MLLGTAHHFAIGSGAFREGRVFSIPSYRGVEVRRPEGLRASVSQTTIFIMPTRASVCSTGGRLQMVKISKRSVGKLKSYEH